MTCSQTADLSRHRGNHVQTQDNIDLLAYFRQIRRGALLFHTERSPQPLTQWELYGRAATTSTPEDLHYLLGKIRKNSQKTGLLFEMPHPDLNTHLREEHHRSKSFYFFPPSPFKGLHARQGHGQTHLAAAVGNELPHLEPTF